MTYVIRIVSNAR